MEGVGADRGRRAARLLRPAGRAVRLVRRAGARRRGGADRAAGRGRRRRRGGARHRRARRPGCRSRGARSWSRGRRCWCSARPASSARSPCRRRGCSAPAGSSRPGATRRCSRARARLGADATVDLTATSRASELTQAFRDAAGGDVDVVHDPLWGAPAAAAVEALGVGGRLVQLGQSAGAEATLPSARSAAAASTSAAT